MEKFNDVGTAEQVVWDMRLADFKRGSNRALLNRLFNGEPPETEEEAIENQNQVNRNFLEGTNILSQSRAQWNNAMLKTKNYFAVHLDSGEPIKRQEYAHIITTAINRQLKRSRKQMEQTRAEGANVVLHGIAPSTFKDRRCPIPSPLPVSSLMIPSETDLDFDNLEYKATFHEWTPYQLYCLTHGPKRDPGWNMDAVEQAWTYTREQLQKEPSSSNYQYMPERIAELNKQDSGYWGSDAVPTTDVWVLDFRDSGDGNGWYRRIFLDWGVGSTYITDNKTAMPDSRNKAKSDKKYGGFLYSSGKRKYANYLSEILQCQFGDCSAVAPFKYHSVRSLGWMLWGICEIQNRLHCRVTENTFMQLLWWFRCASGPEMARVKKAMFENMGVIPAGITMVTANERFAPNEKWIENAFARNRQIMGDNSAMFTKGQDLGEEETATGTMAKVHTMNALVSGMMTLAYEYSKYKYQEQCRRFCIKDSPYKMVRDFRRDCLKDGVPPEMLDAERWDIEPDRALGDGNKILEMAIVQFLQGIRKNLGPDAQRKVDHISIVAATDQPKLAEDLAPIEGQKKLSPSVHDAQLATDRILRGLDFKPSGEMVIEDYVTTWLSDMGQLVKLIQESGQVGTLDQLLGLARLDAKIKEFLGLMALEEQHKSSGDAVKQKVREYGDALGQLMNLVKGFAQRFKAQNQKQGNGGLDPKTAAQLKGKMMMDQLKAKTTESRSAQRAAHSQVAFEMEQRRQDQETQAEIQRENAKAAHELLRDSMRPPQPFSE